MTITINAQGAERKRLVKTIAEWLGEDVHYCGAPTFAYEIGRFTVEKRGSLTFSDMLDSAVVERLLEHIYDEGFDIDQSHTEEDDTDSTDNVIGDLSGISIQLPASGFTESSLANLQAIIDAKGNLIKKALGAEALPINRLGNRIDFPWFRPYADPQEVQAYMHFITALCEMARTQKRITAKEKEVDNEKYAFRCFLLRLGFIGEEFKAERKILLRNLTGSSAFKSGAKEDK
ncbi:MAG: virulence protein [Clostridia bacterium]|nr:virulence protein [Clostridia bacterium]